MNVPSIDRLPIYRAASGATQGGRFLGVGAYPNGLGYANTSRMNGVGGWSDDLANWGKQVLGPLFEVGKDLLSNLLQTQVVKAKVAIGYKFTGVVNVGGSTVLKGTSPQGTPIYFDPKTGRETVATPEMTAGEQRYDAGSGRWATAGIVGGGLLVAGVLLFLLMRRK